MNIEEMKMVANPQWFSEKTDDFLNENKNLKLGETTEEQLKFLEKLEIFMNCQRVSEEFKGYEIEPAKKGLAIWKK